MFPAFVQDLTHVFIFLFLKVRDYNMTFKITVFKGQEIEPYTRLLSEMRVSEFYNFPYLYSGNVEDDYTFTKDYALSKQGMLIVAFKDDQICGLYSGMPLQSPSPFLKHFCKTLAQNRIDASKCYYSGELIIQPEYRRNYLAKELMQRFITEVNQMGFNQIMGITSLREIDHPLRPKNYFDTDTVWAKQGFQKMAFNLSCAYSTRQPDGSVIEADNLMSCWLKSCL